MLTPNEVVLSFRGAYVCANFGENRSRNATVRVLADGQTDTQTDRQTQTDFIICPMLYAIAMGQIMKKLYCSVSVVLHSLFRRTRQAFIAVGSLYNVLSPKLPNNSVRELIRNSFATSVDL